MAHISRPKNQHQNSHNHHPQLPSRGNRPGHTIPIPGVTKSVPGYPGFGPPLPGPDLEGVRNRSPDQADKYYPEWTSKNLDRNQYAESERLAAERLLEETLDLLKETKIRTKQVGLNRTEHMSFPIGQTYLPDRSAGMYSRKKIWCDLCDGGQNLPPLFGIGLRYLKI